MKLIRELEERIVGKFVDDALKAGYRLAVSLERGWDVNEMLIGSRDRAAIMEAAFAGDECHIAVQSHNGPLMENGQVVSEGWVYCVMGNDGYDVISDYTVGLESLLAGANAIADQYA